MKLPLRDAPHLTYCTNIHGGESLAQVDKNIRRYALAVKRLVAPNRPFGVGLRLSAKAAATLAQHKTLTAFRRFLDASGLYVFTINGFSYGTFHGTRVKERVYLPDWSNERRLKYTNRLAVILSALLPDEPGLEGSISTVPGAFKAAIRSESAVRRMARLMILHLGTLYRIREKTGKIISLALEPEPSCCLETVAETIRFFKRHLFSQTAQKILSAETGISAQGSREFIRRHLGVCFDACHMAVEFEDPRTALKALQTAGIRVIKLQLSSGLRVMFAADS